MADIDVQFRATPAQALDFMINLARHDDFREAVALKPIHVLVAYGIFVFPAGGAETDQTYAREAAEWKPLAEMDEDQRAATLQAARDNELATQMERQLEESGYTNKGFLPPKHVVEQALANVHHANEFGGPGIEGFMGIDSFGFWLFLPLTST